MTSDKMLLEKKAPLTKDDIVAQLSTTTAMAMSTSFCMERKFLSALGSSKSAYSLSKSLDGNRRISETEWIQIKQIGKPESEDFKSCFASLQNILHACALPKSRLLFLITGEDKQFKIFMGLRRDEDCNTNETRNAINEINEFCNVCWPGLKSEIVRNKQDILHNFIEKDFRNAYAFTGIPSLDLNKTNYPATIEYLLGGCRPKGRIAYLVVAEPVTEEDVDNMIYMCDEIKGQAESFKSFTVNQTFQESTAENITRTYTETTGTTTTDGTSQRDIKSGIKALLSVGIGVAAIAAFPPAAALVGGASAALTSALGEMAASQLIGSASFLGLNLLASFIPQKSHSTSSMKQKAEGLNVTHGITESYSSGLTRTIVNGHVDSVMDLMKSHGQRFRNGKAVGVWNVGCYLFTDESNATSQIQLRSILTGDSSQYEPIRIHNIGPLLNQRDNERPGSKSIVPFLMPPELYVTYEGTRSCFQHPLGNRFSRLTTCLTTEELTSMINFPLHSVPGISVMDSPPEFPLHVPDTSAYKYPVKLGELIYHGDKTDIECTFDLNCLTSHCLVCGVNGSGKTNTVMSILNAMTAHKKNFMVIEPAKSEYVNWAISFNDMLKAAQEKGERLDEEPIVIYMPGKETYWHSDNDGNNLEYVLKDKLQINPFEPVTINGKMPNVQAHLDRLKSIFALAFPMEDILPTVMETLLREVYTYGEPWLNRRRNTPAPELYPTLGLLSCWIDNVVSKLGYEPKVTGNIKAALNLRINNLLSGWKRELLNNEVLGGYKKLSKTEKESGVRRPTWNEFFNRKVVINLSGISDDSDRTFIMGLLLLYLYEYRIARSETPGFNFNRNELEHLVVIEEAHRVMMNNPNPDSPQYKCGQLFSNLLSEIRAYRQGIMIVDQVPARLISDAVKNTNLKIIHRILSADDAQIVSDSMGITEKQKKIIPKLTTGQAIVSGISSGYASIGNEACNYWCKVTFSKKN